MEKLLLNKSQSVAFTGHRNIEGNKRLELRVAVDNALIELHQSGYRNFINGMAMGFDLLAASAVIALKRRFSDVKLIAVVPYRNQSEKFSDYEQKRYQYALQNADEVIVLREKYCNGCLLRRNDYMLAHASGLIAYYDGKPKGGTFYTIRKASESSMPIINLFR
ncbi:SLOG family protein [Bacteroides thetaiotaomicron]|uniref:SLOG family protein n=1 Tax=Bacteroides thetaiotaomicron TaxID=818 RepID=UPI004062B64B